MTSWRVVLNSKLWDQDLFEKRYLSNPTQNNSLAQSKGKARMILCPKKGESVVFVYKKKIVMKGYLETDGFIVGTDHQNDVCNKGSVREHAEEKEFAWVKITDVGLSEDIRATGQRTWARMNV